MSSWNLFFKISLSGPSGSGCPLEMNFSGRAAS